jgi:hypothetical protein
VTGVTVVVAGVTGVVVVVTGTVAGVAGRRGAEVYGVLTVAGVMCVGADMWADGVACAPLGMVEADTTLGAPVM